MLCGPQVLAEQAGWAAAERQRRAAERERAARRAAAAAARAQVAALLGDDPARASSAAAASSVGGGGTAHEYEVGEEGEEGEGAEGGGAARDGGGGLEDDLARELALDMWPCRRGGRGAAGRGGWGGLGGRAAGWRAAESPAAGGHVGARQAKGGEGGALAGGAGPEVVATVQARRECGSKDRPGAARLRAAPGGVPPPCRRVRRCSALAAAQPSPLLSPRPAPTRPGVLVLPSPNRRLDRYSLERVPSGNKVTALFLLPQPAAPIQPGAAVAATPAAVTPGETPPDGAATATAAAAVGVPPSWLAAAAAGSGGVLTDALGVPLSPHGVWLAPWLRYGRQYEPHVRHCVRHMCGRACTGREGPRRQRRVSRAART